MRVNGVGLRVAFLGALAFGVAGCTRSLDMDGVGQAIRSGIKEQLGLTVAELSCPESREMKAEDAFECTATTQGGARIQVSVTQNDDEGNVSWETAGSQGLLDLGQLEAQIRSGLLDQVGVEAQVDCGGRFSDTPAGESFVCTATDGQGKTAEVRVTVRDAEGNVDWKIGDGGDAAEEPAG
jgi:Domain of unknown function (DUF4333)